MPRISLEGLDLALMLRNINRHEAQYHQGSLYLETIAQAYQNKRSDRAICIEIICTIFIKTLGYARRELIRSMILNNWIWMITALQTINNFKMLAPYFERKSISQTTKRAILEVAVELAHSLSLPEFRTILNNTETRIVHIANATRDGLLFTLAKSRACKHKNIAPHTIDSFLQVLLIKIPAIQEGIVESLYKASRYNDFKAFLLLFNLAMRHGIVIDDEDFFACYNFSSHNRIHSNIGFQLANVAISEFICSYLHQRDSLKRKADRLPLQSKEEFRNSFLKFHILESCGSYYGSIPHNVTHLLFELDDLKFLRSNEINLNNLSLEGDLQLIDTSNLIEKLDAIDFDFQSENAQFIIRNMIRANNRGLQVLYRLGIFTEEFIKGLNIHNVEIYLYLYEILSEHDQDLLSRVTTARDWDNHDLIMVVIANNNANLMQYLLTNFPQYFEEGLLLIYIDNALSERSAATWQALYRAYCVMTDRSRAIDLESDLIRAVINAGFMYWLDPIQLRKLDLSQLYAVILRAPPGQSAAKFNIACALGHLPKNQQTVNFVASFLVQVRSSIARSIFLQTLVSRFPDSQDVLLFVFQELKKLLVSSAKKQYILTYIQYAAQNQEPRLLSYRISRKKISKIIRLDTVAELHRYHDRIGRPLEFITTTALIQAIENVDLRIVIKLCDMGIDVNKASAEGTPLELAILATILQPTSDFVRSTNLFEIIYLLIAHGAKGDNSSPHIQAFMAQVKLLMLVIHFDFNINRRHTPLRVLPETCMDRVLEYCGTIYQRPEYAGKLPAFEKRTLLKFAANPARMALAQLVQPQTIAQQPPKKRARLL